jgi:hypothetical protein
VFDISKKTKIIIGLIGCLMVCLFGVYRLTVDVPSLNSLFIPILFAVTGFIGLIANIIQLKRIH